MLDRPGMLKSGWRSDRRGYRQAATIWRIAASTVGICRSICSRRCHTFLTLQRRERQKLFRGSLAAVLILHQSSNERRKAPSVRTRPRFRAGRASNSSNEPIRARIAASRRSVLASSSHHSRHRQGEAAGRRGHRGGAWRSGPESGKLVPLDLKAGDWVLFGKWSGTEVKIDGEDLLIMKESDIMGVIEGTGPTKKKAA